jgi:DNA-binding IclR family transcriptional regulator
VSEKRYLVGTRCVDDPGSSIESTKQKEEAVSTTSAETGELAGLSALRKATRVLEALAERGSLTAGELSEILDEPVTTVYRMLTNLGAAGWIERDGRKGSPVRLGVDLIAIGQAVEDALDVRAIARAGLQRLSASTSETAYFCVRDGHRAACIESVDGLQTRTAELPIGGSLPLHQGAGPRAILAHLPETFRQRYIAALQSFGANPATGAQVRELGSELDAIRSAGYAITDGDVLPGVYSCAAPVRDHRGDVIGSISLSGLSSRTEPLRLEFGSLVRQEALLVSAELGHRDAEQ